MGVNRLNIGCQSFDDDALAFLGRRHTAGRAREAILAAREAGFSELGLDLIYGLPAGIGDRPDAHAVWMGTLETALSFRPEHLSCYQLTVEADTPLAGRLETQGLSLAGEDGQARFFFETSERLETAGYEHYEVSNFARGARHRSRHNGKYWNRAPYLGIGPAAHSFDGLRRWWNPPDVASWGADLRAGRRPLAGEETLSAESHRLEALFLGLRTSDGIDLDTYRTRYGCDLRVERGHGIDRLVAEGLARIEGNRLSPTRRGLACADAVARWLV
jgi:oxygen-independent coproporphyrinogen-3 oxidase